MAGPENLGRFGDPQQRQGQQQLTTPIDEFRSRRGIRSTCAMGAQGMLPKGHRHWPNLIRQTCHSRAHLRGQCHCLMDTGPT